MGTKQTKKTTPEIAPEVKPKKTRRTKQTCLECNKKFFREDMTEGKRICKPCNAKRAAASKAKIKEADLLDIPADIEADEYDLSDAFENRDALSTMLKQNLNQAINDANQAIAFQKKRLEVARQTGSAKLLNEATKGLEAAQRRHVELCTRLMEKLQSLDDLRAKEERAKPVAMYVNQYPIRPQIVQTREVPLDDGDKK